jgi:hypothetical protein
MTEIPLTPSRPEFLALAKTGNLIPVYTEFVADYETPKRSMPGIVLSFWNQLRAMITLGAIRF